MLALGVIFVMPSPVTGNINANKDRGNTEHPNTHNTSSTESKLNEHKNKQYKMKLFIFIHLSFPFLCGSQGNMNINIINQQTQSEKQEHSYLRSDIINFSPFENVGLQVYPLFLPPSLAVIRGITVCHPLKMKQTTQKHNITIHENKNNTGCHVITLSRMCACSIFFVPYPLTV